MVSVEFTDVKVVFTCIPGCGVIRQRREIIDLAEEGKTIF